MTARTSSVEGVNELHATLADDDAFEIWCRQTIPRVFAYLWGILSLGDSRGRQARRRPDFRRPQDPAAGS